MVDSEGTPESVNTPLEGNNGQAPQVAPRLNWPPWSQLNEDQRNWVRANPEALRYYQLVAQQERANGGGNAEGDMDVDEMLMTLPTVRDGEAFAAKHMPDLGQEVDDFQVQTWKIENWSQQGKRLQGPEFSCGGHKWWVDVDASSTAARECSFPYAYALRHCQENTPLPSGKRQRTAERHGLGLP